MYFTELISKEDLGKKMFKVSYYVLGSQEIRKLRVNVQLHLCLCRHQGTVLIETDILLRKSEVLGYTVPFP